MRISIERVLFLLKRTQILRHAHLRRVILAEATGILHLGAHVGGEAVEYSKLGIPVVWVEGDPSIYAELEKSIAPLSRHRGLLALLGAEDKDSVKFNLASNNGGSSSLYALEQNHGFEKIGLEMVGSKMLPMKRLDSALDSEQVKGLSHWVVDLQGAELEALKGADSLLDYCQTLEIEVSLRKIYKGGVQYAELKEFLREKGLSPLWNPHPGFHGDHFFFRFRQPVE
jgi:FkbM family methyltransferase